MRTTSSVGLAFCRGRVLSLTALIAIALTAWPPMARLARAEALSLRRADFIAAICIRQHLDPSFCFCPCPRGYTCPRSRRSTARRETACAFSPPGALGTPPQVLTPAVVTVIASARAILAPATLNI